MPSIADLYSTIDSYKRRAADVLSDPQNSLMQMLGYANDRARNYNESLAQASKERGYGPKTQELAQAMAEAYNPVGMTTWHGSPHTFNKFDLSKIGTGEGAQAYGHGIYVAENPKVADQYRKDLSAIVNYDQNTKKYQVLDQSRKVLGEYDDMLKAGQEADKAGNLYKVDLPDEHIEKMLDWDKSWKQQPKNVQDAINIDNLLKYYKAEDLPTSQVFYHANQNMSPKDFAKFLSDKGVPGIKYLDEQSRATGEGTRNFVIFDPNIAKIEERNSIPIPQDPHAPNYLEDVHNALAQKPIDVTDVHAPNYLEDIHNQLANQQ